MAHETIKRTISGEEDQRVIVDNLHPPLVRKMIIGSDWTKIRCAIRISWRRTTSIANCPDWYFGLCSGTSAPPGSATPNHFYGVRSNCSSRSLDPYSTNRMEFIVGSTNYIESSVIVNGSETVNYIWFNGADGYIATVENGSVIMGFEITKSGTSFTLEVALPYSTSSGLSGTTDNFKLFMDGASLPSNSSSPFYIYKKDITKTIDEAANGALDSLCFHWPGTTDAFEVSDIDYARLA